MGKIHARDSFFTTGVDIHGIDICISTKFPPMGSHDHHTYRVDTHNELLITPMGLIKLHPHAADTDSQKRCNPMRFTRNVNRMGRSIRVNRHLHWSSMARNVLTLGCFDVNSRMERSVEQGQIIIHKLRINIRSNSIYVSPHISCPHSPPRSDVFRSATFAKVSKLISESPDTHCDLDSIPYTLLKSVLRPFFPP
jgi:hypothetical protein